MGLTPWVRRAATVAPTLEVESAPIGAGVACVVVLPEQCSARELDLLGRALSAGGAWLARAARIRVKAGQLAADVPVAQAYLVFGENQALIVLADEPSLVLGSAAAKRRLWSATRSLRRALATTGD